MIISFAWTTAAFVAGAKTCTRRNWSPEYAARFKAGTIHQGYDRTPRIGGHKVGELRIERDPYPEPLWEAPESDFEKEGLAWMESKGLFIQGKTPYEFWRQWKQENPTLYVVRFAPILPVVAFATYPADWPVIATRIKDQAGWKCERCGHTNDRASGHVLTVHHLDGDKTNCEDWNLAALCQRCHLHIQGVVNMFQEYMFEHTSWMKPHVDGRNAAIAKGEWPRETA